MEEDLCGGASVSKEAGGDSLGGGAIGDELLCSEMGSSIPRAALVEASAEDKSLQLARQLAREGRQGYGCAV